MFNKVWSAATTGGAVGLFIGACWQISGRARRNGTSAPFLLLALVAWSAFATLSLMKLGPNMQAEERVLSEVRALTPEAIRIFEFGDVEEGARPPKIRDEKVGTFCLLTQRAELFYPSHESATQEYEITLRLIEGRPNVVRAWIPERHLADLALRFEELGRHVEILLPGGKS